MGAQPTEVVSVIAEGETEGPFAVRRHPKYPSGPFQNPPGFDTLQAITLNAFKQYPDRPYLQRRVKLPDGTFSETEFFTLTYRQGEDIAYRVGYALDKLDIHEGTMFGVYAPNCFEWMHIIDASVMYGFVLVALYDTLGTGAIQLQIKHSEMQGILTARSNIGKLVGLFAQDQEKKEFKVRFVVVIEDTGYDDEKAQLEKFGLRVLSFKDLLEMGEGYTKELPDIKGSQMSFICYSSGTTGTPKGIIMSHSSFASTIHGCGETIKVSKETRHLSYMPYAHAFERVASGVTAGAGGVIGFTSDGVRNLRDDLRVFRPTYMCAVPRVMGRFYDGIMNKIKGSIIKRGLFWGCWYIKKFCIRHDMSTRLVDKLVFDKMTAMLGGNMGQIVVGGAAMDAHIQDVLQVAFGIPLRTGYGCTEGGSGMIMSPLNVKTCKPGTVGGPITTAELKLEPIEEYDDPNCGELLIGGPMITPGYLHDKEATDKLFVDKEHTWIRTGDVACWDKDGYLKIVDRLRSIFKLAQGEYVAADQIGQTYEYAQSVKQVFIYGDSFRRYLVAVVVPERSWVTKFLGKEELTDEEFARACEDETVKKAILDDMTETGKRGGLFGFQCVKAIHLDPQEWTIESELLTPTQKLKRKKLEEKYKKEVEALYASMDAE